MTASRTILSVETRFFRHVDKTDCCWLWTGALNEHGYGVFNKPADTPRGMATCKAHRFAYELLVGPIPEGLDLDHVYVRGCRYRNCVNPAHLEPVTNHENSLRGLRSQKTHCPQGHKYTVENTRIGVSAYGHPDRQCRTCERRQQLARRLPSRVEGAFACSGCAARFESRRALLLHARAHRQ